MKTKQFLSGLDHERLVAAIARAESISSGEIRVMVARGRPESALAAAREEFVRLGMERTAARNGVLIYVAPQAQGFALVGDEGVDARCGPTFWAEVARDMGEHFKAGRHTDAIVLAIGRVGEMLAKHFPRQGPPTNELPDAVVER